MTVEPSDKGYISPTRSLPKDENEEWKDTGFREADLKEGARFAQRSKTPQEILDIVYSEGPISRDAYISNLSSSSSNGDMWRTNDDSLEGNFMINIERGGKSSTDSITEYGKAVVEYMNESSKFPSVTEEKPAPVNGASADDGDILEPIDERSASDDIDGFLEPLRDARAFARTGQYDRARKVASVYGDWGHSDMEDTVDTYIDQVSQ